MAIVHHEVYVFLDGTRVNAKFGPHGQAIVPALGTFLAYIGHTVLAAAIGVAFVQVLWWRLRTRDHSVKHINALISCQQSPFTPSSFSAWSPSTILLVVVAALANFMAAITIWAPGALSIISGHESLPCTIRTPDLAVAHLGINDYPNPNALSFATRAVVQGYLPPLRQCNQTCYFDVEYFAPAVNCTSTTDSVNFTAWLPPDIYFRSTYSFGTSGLFIQAAMITNAGTGQKEAVACTAFNATYIIRITNSGNSSTAILLEDPTLLNPITTTTLDSDTGPNPPAMGALTDALADSLSGTINSSEWSWSGSVIQYTSMAHEAFYLNQTQDLMWILHSVVENVSLSIPSGFLDLDDYPSTLVPSDGTCVYSVNVYTYNNKHLLLAYGSCLVVSLICGTIAIIAIGRDGNEFLDFARMLEAIPGQGLASNLGTEAHLKVDDSGLFRVADTTHPSSGPVSKEA
jgi:hypothetical protein